MKRCFLIFVVLLLLVPSCKKHEEELPTFEKSDFPATKNSYWIYRFQNFSNGQEYPLMLKIADVITLNADTQIISYQLLYDSIYLNDSAIGILTNKSFTFQSVTNNWTQFGNYSLNFPFTIGSKWESINPVDTLQALLYADSYSIESKNFKDVFSLYNHYQNGSSKSSNEIYLSKKVGIISKLQNTQNSNPLNDRNQTYTLIDYHIE